ARTSACASARSSSVAPRPPSAPESEPPPMNGVMTSAAKPTLMRNTMLHTMHFTNGDCCLCSTNSPFRTAVQGGVAPLRPPPARAPVNFYHVPAYPCRKSAQPQRRRGWHPAPRLPEDLSSAPFEWQSHPRALRYRASRDHQSQEHE